MFGRLGHGDEDSRVIPTRVAALEDHVITATAAGTHHTLALTQTGEAFSWGLGSNGRLGHGDEQGCLMPRRITALGERSLTSVAAGHAHSLAVTDRGVLLSWGNNENGQLGHRDNRQRLVPTCIRTLQSGRVVAVTAGSAHSVAVTDRGRAFGWGAAAKGDPRLGLGTSKVDLLMPRPYDEPLRCGPRAWAGALAGAGYT
jgi:alpha-tubulin suppressor-like RCC1 family protein